MRDREEENGGDLGEVKEEKGKMNHAQNECCSFMWRQTAEIKVSDLSIVQMSQTSRSDRDQSGVLSWGSSTERIKRCTILSGRRSSLKEVLTPMQE